MSVVIQIQIKGSWVEGWKGYTYIPNLITKSRLWEEVRIRTPERTSPIVAINMLREEARKECGYDLLEGNCTIQYTYTDGFGNIIDDYDRCTDEVEDISDEELEEMESKLDLTPLSPEELKESFERVLEIAAKDEEENGTHALDVKRNQQKHEYQVAHAKMTGKHQFYTDNQKADEGYCL